VVLGVKLRISSAIKPWMISFIWGLS